MGALTAKADHHAIVFGERFKNREVKVRNCREQLFEPTTQLGWTMEVGARIVNGGVGSEALVERVHGAAVEHPLQMASHDQLVTCQPIEVAIEADFAAHVPAVCHWTTCVLW